MLEKNAPALITAANMGDEVSFGELLQPLNRDEDAIMSMPPWVYWLRGRDALAEAFLNPATLEGKPRPGRYRLVPAAMNGQPDERQVRGEAPVESAIVMAPVGNHIGST
jgi:hypothetical protein